MLFATCLAINDLCAGVSPIAIWLSDLQVGCARLTSEVSTSRNIKHFKIMSEGQLWRYDLMRSSVVDSLLNPLAMRISSVVL